MTVQPAGITAEEARQLTDRIKIAVEGTWQLILEAFHARVWGALGYGSWDEYCTREFGTSRLRLPREERQEVVASLREHGLSERAIAAATGMGRGSVQRDLKAGTANAAGTERNEESPSAGGPFGPPAEGDEEFPEVTGEENGGDLFAPSWPPPMQPPAPPPSPPVTGLDGKRYPVPSPPPPAPQPAHVRRNTGENEWYTPHEYVEAARAVMGSIDLDPASTEKANEVVKATRICTALNEPDGLGQVWSGRVWLNPPYERGLVDKFCDRLAAEYAGEAVTQACVLVNNSTDSSWFQELLGVSAAICFPLYRIRFWHPEGRESNPLQGQAIFYLGENVEMFRQQFSQFGGVVQVLSGKIARVGAAP